MSNNKLKYQFPLSYERQPLSIFLRVAIGAAGAPTLQRGKGVLTIARTGAGVYLVTLAEKYNALLAASAAELNAAAQDLGLQINAFSGSAKTVTLGFKTAGAFTDPANGSVLYIELKVTQSRVV